MKETDYSTGGLRAFLLAKNADAVRQVNELKKQKAALTLSEEDYAKKVAEIKSGKQTPTIIIKATDQSSYKNLVSALDEMLVCQIGKYVITDLAEGDEFLLKNYETQGKLSQEIAMQ